MSDLSPLQRRKASYYFDLIDEDDNGVIEADDFDLRADRLADAQNVTDDAERDALRDRVHAWWEHLCSIADLNEDDRVSPNEWHMYWRSVQAAVNTERADAGDDATTDTIESLERAAHGTFRAIDTDDTGQVTEEDYARWLAAWGIEQSAPAFRQLDRNDKGYLTEADLAEAVKEFYLADNPDAPGNALYGELPESS